jgi:phage tail protein X
VSEPEQEQLAQRIIQRLDDGVDQLDAGTRERLLAARRAALARYQEARVRVFGLRVAGPVGEFLGQHVFGTSVAAVVTALVVATAGVAYWQSIAPNGDSAEVEIALLTDELPINAYLDKGFDSWLKRSPR